MSASFLLTDTNQLNKIMLKSGMSTRNLDKDFYNSYLDICFRNVLFSWTNRLCP